MEVVANVAEDWDRLVRELKSLRQGRGLSLQGLAKCSRLMSALDDPPLQEAHDQVCALVDDLGDDERAVALHNAYAIGMRVPLLLMARRTDLHNATGRDIKTIAKYEDQMIEELASRILGTTKREVSDSDIFVVGHLTGTHLDRVTVTVRFKSAPGDDIAERSVDYENHSTNHSLPALLYQLPREWEPHRLTLAVLADKNGPVQRYWAAPASELLSLMYAEFGQEIPATDGQAVMEVTSPKPGIIYAIYWTS